MDLIGGSFAVIESDPGVFTQLTRKLGVKNVSLVELYDIEPWATDHLLPHGLIFCYLWRKDIHRPVEFEDEKVWFANQISDDACASHAILNVLLNCPSLDLGQDMQHFKLETKEMSPVMKGLAVTNQTFIRDAHNSLARKADIRGALNTIATTTLDAQKAKAKAVQQQALNNKKPTAGSSKKTPAKTKAKPKTSDSADTSSEEEAYHFIGYVPAFGKVWELDGLKPGPLEVGELASENDTSDWMNVVRPALRMKMAKYGGGGAEAANIRFSLLALVDGTYEKANDEWEYWRRERRVLERRLDQTNEGWRSQVDPELLVVAEHAFTLVDAPGRMLMQGGAPRLNRDAEILTAAPDTLLPQWENAVRQAVRTKVTVEDEIHKATTDWTDHIKRTHDYEPFIVEYVKCLRNDGILDVFLDDGKPVKKKKSNEEEPQSMEKAGSAKRPKVEVEAPEIEKEDEIEEDYEMEDSLDADGDWKPSASRRKQ